MYTIYAYKKISNNQVVYVGQTCNLPARRKQHEKDEPYNSNRAEYDYPLSRAIRKYGADAFECFVLEEVETLERANIQEDYWILKYDTINKGYNQMRGGNNRTKMSPEFISALQRDLVLGKESYTELSRKYNCSSAFISTLNNGQAHYDKNLIYPLRKTKAGRHFDEQAIEQIIELLKDKTITLKEIANRFNVSQNVIVRINQGESYHNDNLIYPIRTGRAKRS